MEGSLVSLSGLILGNHIYDIPVYQRSYAWERKNVEDLWEDLYYLDPSKKHYFGAVLLKDSGETVHAALAVLKRFDVIDGQQRLTTVLILLREIISQIEEVSDDDLRVEVAALKKGYLKDGSHYKLNPPGDDGSFFHDYVIDGNEFLESSTTTHSQRRLKAAKDFFRERLVEEKQRQPSKFQDFLVQFKTKIDDLQLIQYQVNSDADAIRMFETVNDRGRPLSNLEKTKSFLMHASYLGIEDDAAVAAILGDLNGHFARIYRHFEGARETRHLERLRLTEDDVHRYHFINYISTGGAASQPLDSLKVSIRDMLRQDPNQCIKYTLSYAKDLEQAFVAVSDIIGAYEKDEEGGTLSRIFMLERMGNIFPLLIASWLKFGDDAKHMDNILRLLETFIVRVYLVGGYRSDTGATRFNEIANRLHQSRLDYNGLIGALEAMIRDYQDDNRFDRSLRREDFYNYLGSRNIKYLLTQYEVHLREKGDVALALTNQEAILTSDYEVEHIWPQNPAGTSMEENADHQRNVHRLGNLTIALKPWNISMGNRPFQEKKIQPESKASYANSSLLVQKELTNWSEWDVDAISQREDKIAKFALQRWSV